MDKRYTPLSVPEQLALRQQAIDEVLAHPEWPLGRGVRHLRTTLRLTTAELSRLSGVSSRALQDIEQGRSAGTVQTLDRILGLLGLRLGVTRQSAESADRGTDQAPSRPRDIARSG
ncbi:MAG: hypothetical protein RIQ53_1756 [Pseudomonadota bacterium]|jgi:transcriptional regulator with XRE-family HTH domain